MPVEFVGEGAELGRKSEEMVVILIIGLRNAEEGPPSDKLKYKAAETPHIKGFVDGSGKNQLGGSKAAGSEGFGWRVREEICYPT